MRPPSFIERNDGWINYGLLQAERNGALSAIACSRRESLVRSSVKGPLFSKRSVVRLYSAGGKKTWKRTQRVDNTGADATTFLEAVQVGPMGQSIAHWKLDDPD
jgi:hypothetical protein